MYLETGQTVHFDWRGRRVLRMQAIFVNLVGFHALAQVQIAFGKSFHFEPLKTLRMASSLLGLLVLGHGDVGCCWAKGRCVIRAEATKHTSPRRRVCRGLLRNCSISKSFLARGPAVCVNGGGLGGDGRLRSGYLRGAPALQVVHVLPTLPYHPQNSFFGT